MSVSLEERAAEVLRQHWNGRLPVQPGVVARSMGLTLIQKGGAGYRYSGHYRAPSIIEYNSDEPIVRQRFTVAHELGHHVLGHADAPRDEPAAFGASVASPDEREANQFAAALLMPANAVRLLVEGGRYGSIDEIAKEFGVSRAAMIYRIKNLGLSVA